MQSEIPNPEYMDKSVPYAVSRSIVIEVLTTSLGRDDYYFDDIIRIFLG